MPDFHYQIKGRQAPDAGGFSNWTWPPVFSGLVTAESKKAAKAMIDEEYDRTFPLRVLKKDIAEHAYLLHIVEVEPDNDFLRRRFRKTACGECGDIFRPIDKYNDPFSDHTGSEYCSAKCATAGRLRSAQDVVTEGKLPPVIYQVRQKSSGRVYVGQTIRPFTLRWWQHLTVQTGCKFHEAIKETPLHDWEFSVLEVVEIPSGCKNTAGYITGREAHWIDALNSVADGFNTIRPSANSSQVEPVMAKACDSLF